jgi:tungstate transport system substrate-binding protein
MAGDVDAILVHSREAEDAFVASGNGTHRRDVMFNDFILAGPAGDPAGAGQAHSATAALQRIARAQALFISRGDDSGTHKKELALWAAGDMDPDALGDWYRSVGAGMGAALNIASGMNAYVLADRASWLKFGNRGDLTLIFEGDPALFNQYAFIPVNPARHPHVKAQAAKRLEVWLTSSRAAQLINGYTIDGQALFVFNATD